MLRLSVTCHRANGAETQRRWTWRLCVSQPLKRQLSLRRRKEIPEQNAWGGCCAIRAVFYYFEIKEDNVRQKGNQHETET